MLASAKKQMRACYKDIIAGILKWDNSNIMDRFSADKMNKKFVDQILGFDSSLIEIEEQEQEVLEFE